MLRETQAAVQFHAGAEVSLANERRGHENVSGQERKLNFSQRSVPRLFSIWRMPVAVTVVAEVQMKPGLVEDEVVDAALGTQADGEIAGTIGQRGRLRLCRKFRETSTGARTG